MNRRQFAQALGVSVVGVATGATATTRGAMAKGLPPEVAITMDDFRLNDTPVMMAEECNRAILDALRAHTLRAAIFVQGKNADNDTGRRLLGEWNKDGHMIANHSYSHLHYHEVSFHTFAQDVLRGEAVIRDFPRFKKYFRFPYLKEGDTAAKRDGMRAFLRARGYRNGHVTIDASDWYVHQRMLERLKVNAKADLRPYRDFYLNHLWERATFYDDLSKRALGRSVRHTLLIHHNALNGLFLGDALGMFKSKGWKLIAPEAAFADPVFAAAPKILPAGESVVWALAKQSGKFDKILRYPAEDGDYEKARMDELGL